MFTLRTSILWPVGLFCLIALTSVVQAQGNPEEADALFRNLDSNKDGKLTSADTANKRMIDQVFEMAGKPAAGTVTRAEFQQVFERHRAGRGTANPGDAPRPPQGTNSPPGSRPAENGLPPFLRMLDGNGDQRLTRPELNRLSQMFDRLDTNKDGSLDAEELRSAESAVNAPVRGTDRPTPERPAATPGGRDATTSETGNAGAGDGSRLVGVWRGWVVDGRGENPNTGQMEIELTIEANRITGREVGTTRRAPEGIGGGTYVMTGNGASGNLDADGTSGPQDGRHFLGIYELQGDTLRWCVANRGRQRPQAMATDRGNYLMVLRKQATRN